MSRRDDVVAGLRATGGFASAQSVYAGLRARGVRIGLATVYRILAALAAEDAVDVVRSADGESLYRVCGSAAHHHHLICRHCGHAEELDAAVVEEWARRVAEEHDFDAPDHVVEIVGTCAGCRRQTPAAGG